MQTYLSRWPWRGPLVAYNAPKYGTDANLERIAADVAERHGLTVDDLRSPSRQRLRAWPRQEAMAAAYATGRFSTPKIGRFFGGRDHTTVLHAIKAVEKRASAEPVLPRHPEPDLHLVALARAMSRDAA